MVETTEDGSGWANPHHRIQAPMLEGYSKTEETTGKVAGIKSTPETRLVAPGGTLKEPFTVWLKILHWKRIGIILQRVLP